MTTKDELLKQQEPDWIVTLSVDGDVGPTMVPKYLNVRHEEVAALYAFSLMEETYPDATIRVVTVRKV